MDRPDMGEPLLEHHSRGVEGIPELPVEDTQVWLRWCQRAYHLNKIPFAFWMDFMDFV